MFPSIYYPSYTLSFPRYWLVRDKPIARSKEDSLHAGLRFHIEENDYFSTLATILKFYEESIYSESITPAMRKLQLQTIKKVIEDLLYLDKYYMITPKDTHNLPNAKYF